MAHDVFVSHSTKDKPTADAICAVLEAQSIRCWIAPRDIIPGREYGASIIEAIRGAKVMVLVFSTNANESPQINREVERAVHKGIPVIPVRIEDVVPTDSLEYLISTPHWLDAFTPPLDRHLQYLAQVIRQIVGGPPPDKESVAPAAELPSSPPPAKTSTPAPSSPSLPPSYPPPPSSATIVSQAASRPVSAPASTAGGALWSLILGILSFLSIIVCGGVLFGIPAIIFGHVSRSSISKSSGALRGTGMATAGLILGYSALLLSFVIIPLFAIPFIRGFESSFNKSTAQTHRETPATQNSAPPKNEQSAPAGTKEIKATDGNFVFDVPNEWKETTGLNDAASLQVANKVKDQYLIVISESKADLENMTLKKHHSVTRDSTLKRMQNSSATSPQSITIGGFPALQDELSGTQDGTNIVFLHTTIDDGEHFHQILAWTVKSRWAEGAEQLRDVTQSFHTSE
jgi:hypothetical protein